MDADMIWKILLGLIGFVIVIRILRKPNPTQAQKVEMMKRFDNCYGSLLSWKCMACGEIRPDECIDVFKADVSPEYSVPGAVIENRKYCNDNPECLKIVMEMKSNE